MKKNLLMALFAALTMMAATGCSKDDNTDNASSGESSPQVGSYCYSLYTEYENFNCSDMTIFNPLWDTNENGEQVTWMRTITDTRDEADRKAIAAFDSIIGLIDDAAASAALHETDYMTATMQRVEGRPHDLKSKTWRAN